MEFSLKQVRSKPSSSSPSGLLILSGLQGCQMKVLNGSGFFTLLERKNRDKKGWPLKSSHAADPA
jgi:hypothetical protein